MGERGGTSPEGCVGGGVAAGEQRCAGVCAGA